MTARAAGRLLVLAAGMLALPRPAAAQAAPAQRVVQASERVVIVARGQTAILLQPVALQRLSIADPEVAEIFAVSPQEILVNGKKLGTTSLMLWDASGARRLYTVEVTPDVRALEQTLRTLFPSERLTVLASGSSVVLSGTISSAGVARRILEVAGGSGATVVNNLLAPAAPQVLLQVRFAEVTRTAVQELRTQIGVGVGGNGGRDDQGVVQTLSDGLVRAFLLGGNARIEATIQAMQSRGLFRSLAEPNLLALDGQEASFLAGGEFPFPVLQGGGNDATVTIIWKEFGVRLRFKPTVVGDGTIRLRIAPEVSSLDYSNSLRIEGFQIPSLLTRRTETEVVLRDGEYLAIAGLLNNVLEQNTSRIPLLGDLPVLGTLFRSRNARQGRTELLVLVSPRVVQASTAPQPVPTGEPANWEWDRSMRDAQGAAQPAAPRTTPR
ncbi:MAG TPA: pilus assembly protein N-terminal domain-containing protein [Longimicrobium sp.]